MELEKKLQIAEENIEFLQEHLVRPARFEYEECAECGRFDEDTQPEVTTWIDNEFYCIDCYHSVRADE